MYQAKENAKYEIKEAYFLIMRASFVAYSIAAVAPATFFALSNVSVTYCEQMVLGLRLKCTR